MSTPLVSIYMTGIPNMRRERFWYAQGARFVVGVDEAGAGAWAGPIVAGAAILPCDIRFRGLRDSKLLSPTQREAVLHELLAEGAQLSSGQASVEEITQLGLRPANLLAMERAVAGLNVTPDVLLIDWYGLPGISCPQESIAKGDRRIASIAAASVMAKVTRDRLMVELDGLYPAYGFALHKGYGTATHQAALHIHGPSTVHRHSFAPIKRLILSARVGQ